MEVSRLAIRDSPIQRSPAQGGDAHHVSDSIKGGRGKRTPGTNPIGGAVDIDALSAYFAANTPVAPGPQNRISRLN